MYAKFVVAYKSLERPYLESVDEYRVRVVGARCLLLRGSQAKISFVLSVHDERLPFAPIARHADEVGRSRLASSFASANPKQPPLALLDQHLVVAEGQRIERPLEMPNSFWRVDLCVDYSS